MARILRTRNYRANAATRRSIARHAAIWDGTAARFPGFEKKAGK
jgi:hypothetical protein